MRLSLQERREAARLRRAAWRKANPVEDRRQKREYASSHKEQAAINARKYQEAHAGDPRCRYRELVNKARRKGLTCLSFEEFVSLPPTCHYCGFPRPLKGCGLDRLNNSDGYALVNVLTSCTTCNMARGDRFTVTEMEIEIGPAIRRVRISRV